MTTRAVILVCLLMGALSAGSRWHFEDPKGDDHGAGFLVYPGQSAWTKGDADLLSLTIENHSSGAWITVTFANPLKNPSHYAGQFASEDFSQFARHGFFNVNVDLYLDADRLPASGLTHSFPGRDVRIHPATAWERAIIVSPRPTALRQLLIKRLFETAKLEQSSSWHLAPQAQKELKNAIESQVDRTYFFPTKVRVNGRQLRFFVPEEIHQFHDQQAILVVTTAANPETTLPLSFLRKETPPLMNLPVFSGTPYDTLGCGERNPEKIGAVLDVLLPEAGLQERLLDPLVDPDQMSELTGILLSHGTMPPIEELSVALELQPPAAPNPPEILPQPGEEGPATVDSDTSLPSPAPASRLEKPAGDGVLAPAEPTLNISPEVANTTEEATPVAPPAPERISLEKKLQELKALWQKEIITEAEYQRLRQQVLELWVKE
jgi:hypothetical protein